MPRMRTTQIDRLRLVEKLLRLSFALEWDVERLKAAGFPAEADELSEIVTRLDAARNWNLTKKED